MDKSILSKRKIPVSPGCRQLQDRKVTGVLEATSGIENVLFNTSGNHLFVEYDPIKIVYSNIEEILNDQQVSRAHGFKQGLLSIWYDYLDTTARDNALAPPPACCNKPPRRH
jgi:hypothetical protein